MMTVNKSDMFAKSIRISEYYVTDCLSSQPLTEELYAEEICNLSMNPPFPVGPICF